MRVCMRGGVLADTCTDGDTAVNDLLDSVNYAYRAQYHTHIAQVFAHIP